MYNEERKLEFIESLNQDSVKKSMSYLLEMTASVEEMLKKDLCDFTYQEFLMLFEAKKIVTVTSVMSNRSNIKRYIKWCVENNLCLSTQLEEIDRVEQKDLNTNTRVKFEMYKDEDDLLDCINEVLKDYDISFRDMFSVFYGLCWYGLSDEELFTAKKEWFKDDRIELPDRTIHFSERFSKIMNRYTAADSVDIGFIASKQVEFVPSERIIRNVKAGGASDVITSNYNATRNKKWEKVMSELPVENKYYGRKLKPVKIRCSGAFYQIWQREQQGEKINSLNIAELFPYKMYERSEGVIINRNYEDWKKAFGL